MINKKDSEVTLKSGHSLPFMISAVLYSLLLGLPFFVFLALRVWPYAPDSSDLSLAKNPVFLAAKRSVESNSLLKNDIEKKMAELIRQDIKNSSGGSDSERSQEIERLKKVKEAVSEIASENELIVDQFLQDSSAPWWVNYESDFSKVLGWLAIFSSVLSFGAMGAAVSVISRSRLSRDFKEIISLKELLSMQTIGAIFALVLSLMFMGDMLAGTLFPAAEEFGEIIYIEAAFGKLLIWSFIAGFFERFVPGMLENLNRKAQGERVAKDDASTGNKLTGSANNSGQSEAEGTEVPRDGNS